MLPVDDSQIEPITPADPYKVHFKANARHIPVDHPDVDRILGAMRQIESGGNYGVTAKDLGHGAYQYEPDTWKSSSTKYAQKMGLGNGPLPMTKEYQDAVARNDVVDYLQQGYSPKQIASLWNSSHPDWEGRRGVNKYGVKYDVPAHVDKFERAYDRQNMVNKVFSVAPSEPEKPQKSFASRLLELLSPTSAEAAEGETPTTPSPTITWRWYPDGYRAVTPEERRQGIKPDYRMKPPLPDETPTPESIQAQQVSPDELKGMKLPPLSKEAEPEKPQLEPEVEKLEPPETEKPELKDEEPRGKPDIELPEGFEPVTDDQIVPIGQQKTGLAGAGAKFRTGVAEIAPTYGLPEGVKPVSKNANIVYFDPKFAETYLKDIGKGTAATFGEGMAGILKNFNDAINYTAAKSREVTYKDSEGVVHGVTPQAAPELATGVIEYLQKHAAELRKSMKSEDLFQEALSTVAGGLIPSVLEWEMGLPYAALKGYEQGGIPGMAKEVIKRYTLGKFFEKLRPYNRGTKIIAGSTAMGGVAAMDQQDLRHIFLSAVTGGVLTGVGKGGPKSFTDAMKDFKESLPERLNDESGSAQIITDAAEWSKSLIDNARTATGKAAAKIKEAKDSIAALIGSGGDGRMNALRIVMTSKRAAEMAKAEYALREFKGAIESLPKEFQYLQASEYQKGNRAGVLPELLPFFDVMQDLNDKNWSQINSLGGRYLEYTEHYMRGVYKNYDDHAVQQNIKNFFDGQPFDNYLDLVGGKPTKWVRTLDAQGNPVYTPAGPPSGPGRAAPSTEPVRAARPGGKTLTGGRSYFRSKSFESYREALMTGLDPKYDNLYDLVISDHAQKVQYITGMQFWNAGRKSGEVRFFHPVAQPPGWLEIKDSMAQVQTAISTQVGPRIVEQRAYASPSVALVFNNYLSQGLKGKPWYDITRAVIDPARKFRVSLSPYHAWFTMGTDMADGVGQHGSNAVGSLLTGDLENAAKEAGKLGQTLVFAKTLKGQLLGGKITQEFYEPGSNPEYKALVDRFINGGGRMPPPETMDGIVKSYANALRDIKNDLDKSTGSGVHPLTAMDDTATLTSKWIMSYMVPRAKLAAYAIKEEMALKEFNNRDWTGISQAQKNMEWLKISQEIVKFGDSMYGQLAYDNLNWNNTVKDLMFWAIGYPGWNIGSGRWIKSNITGAYQGVKTLATGEKMSLFEKDSLKFTVGLLTKTILWNTTISYLIHGKAPDDPKELVTKGVWTGGYNSDGSKEYMGGIDYLRDPLSLYTDWRGAIASKTPPGLAEAWYIWHDSNYFGNKIFTPGEPLKWPWEFVKAGPLAMFTPFTVQQAAQGHSTVGKYGQLFGETLRPARVTRTPFEAKVAEAYSNRSMPKRTPSEADKALTISNVQRLATDGDMKGFEKGIKDLKAKKLITDRQEENMREKASTGIKKYRFIHLHLNEMIEAYAVGNKEERSWSKSILQDKWDNADETVRADNKKAYNKAMGVR